MKKEYSTITTENETKAEKNALHASMLGKSTLKRLEEPALNPRYRIMTDERARNMSVFVVQMGVLSTSISTTILYPNFPFMVRPGTHEDAFPNTDPFDANGATYFLPMTALLGAAVASTFIGALSDKVGRKPCLMICLGVSILGNLAKYFARHRFWSFCCVNFANGLFGSTLPVALAYISDMRPNRAQKKREIGVMIGYSIVGMAGGGIFTILMASEGLFVPLFLGAAMNFVAYILVACFMIELSPEFGFHEKTEKDQDAPEHLNWFIFCNIILGAVVDAVGSVGLFPLALSPLAFETYYEDFIVAGESPIFGENGYRWLFVLVSVLVVPGAAISTVMFERVGCPIACVSANLLTAIGIAICLSIVSIVSPSTESLIGFVVILCGIYPFTIISQFTTGSMLDMVSPQNRRGFTQGLNITVMNFANAVAPWAMGTLSDNVGTKATLWICVGISVAAAVINFPLIFLDKLKLPHAKEQDACIINDQDITSKARRGEPVPLQAISEINYNRLQQGLPLLIPSVGTYDDDKARLEEMVSLAKNDYLFMRARMHTYLNEMTDPDRKLYMASAFNKAKPSDENMNETAEEIGKWFGDYLKDTGYLYVGHHSILYKMMIMQAFPRLHQNESIDSDNLEVMIARYLTVLNNHLDEGDSKGLIEGFRSDTRSHAA